MARNGTHRPFVTVNGKSITYTTYRALVKALPELFKEEEVLRVQVVRQLRGEWGQYSEVHTLIDGKIKITEETWL